MILGKSQCLYIFVLLYGGSIIALFLRALIRRKLLKDYMSLKGERILAKTNIKLLSFLLTIPKQIQSLRELRNMIVDAPDSVQRRYNYFQGLTWIVITLIVLLVIFSTQAYKMCGST